MDSIDVHQEYQALPVNIKFNGSDIQYVGPFTLQRYISSLFSRVPLANYNRQHPRIVVASYDISIPYNFYAKYRSLGEYFHQVDKIIISIRDKLVAGQIEMSKQLQEFNVLSEKPTLNRQALASYSTCGDFILFTPMSILLAALNDSYGEEVLLQVQHELVHFDLGISDYKIFERNSLGAADSWGGVFTNRFNPSDSLEDTLREMSVEYGNTIEDMHAFDELLAYSLIDCGDMYNDPSVRCAQERGVDTEEIKRSIQECKRRCGIRKTIQIGKDIMNRTWADSEIIREAGGFVNFRARSVFEYMYMLDAA